MVKDRQEIVAELRRLATLSKDAERERKLLDLAERIEAGDDVGSELDQLPADLT